MRVARCPVVCPGNWSPVERYGEHAAERHGWLVVATTGGVPNHRPGLRSFPHANRMVNSQKKDQYRRNGKGRRCCLGVIQFFAQGRFWTIGWIHSFPSNHPGAIHPILQMVIVQNVKCTCRSVVAPVLSSNLCDDSCTVTISHCDPLPIHMSI